MHEEKQLYKKSFTQKVLVPFLCGAVGGALVLGIGLGVPYIKNKLIDFNETEEKEVVVRQTLSNNFEQVSLTEYSDTAIYSANKVLPSIVGINVEYNITSNSFYRGMQGQISTATASGSGIIISEDGYILTNNHIINSSDSSSYYSVSEATSVKVKLYNDETEYEAKIIGTDIQTDLAVIKIEKTDLTPAEIGDSSICKVGEFVLAVGNPLGMQNSVSSGIISAVNRKVKADDGTEYVLIQTDSAINSGNSGGALVNSKGQIIGVNTLKMFGSGIEGMGFAIPINDTIDIYKQLIESGKISRPYVGIEAIDLNEETAKKYNLVKGIYIKTIEAFSASEKAGLEVGDVIISVDGKDIKTMDELNKYKSTKKVGDVITIKIYRNGNEKEISLTLEEQP
ncbi:MAG: trypsin-like peptidase domain-containing protein [Lachnospiraceae bacterium]|jgi:serine protease Do|nr:trypsin-like peptidase domain-containing protein [Lachnospiraceae bacterium]